MHCILLVIHILMYNFLCLHSDQTLASCRCVHAEYNNNSALKTPIGPAVGVLSCVYWVAITIPTLRKGIESQLFTELGSSSRFVSIPYGFMPITTMGGAY